MTFNITYYHFVAQQTFTCATAASENRVTYLRSHEFRIVVCLYIAEIIRHDVLKKSQLCNYTQQNSRLMF